MLHTAHRKGLKGSVMSDEKSKVSFLYHGAAIYRPPLYQLSVILSLSDLGPVTPPQFLRLPRAKHRLCRVCDVRVALMIVSVDFGSLSKPLSWL